MIFTIGLHLTNNKKPTHYNLPDIPGIKTEEITRIVITKTDSNLSLEKNSSLWQISPNGYPADQEKMAGIIDTIKNLNIVMLISELKNDVIFGLDNRNKITVTAYNGYTILREFEVGNTGPSRSHTFVKLRDDYRVYYANNSFRSIFEITADLLRDNVPR